MKAKLLILSALTALTCVSCGLTGSQSSESNTDIPVAEKSLDDMNDVDKEMTEKGNTPYYKVTVREYDADGGYAEHTEVKNCFDDVLSYNNENFSDPDNEYKYNADGLILENKYKRSGVTTSYEYDEYGNLTCKVTAYDSETLGVQTERHENEYDTSGKLVKCTMFTSSVRNGEDIGGSGDVREYKYDANGNLSEESDIVYGKNTYTYDDRGNIVIRENVNTTVGHTDRFVSEYNSRDLPKVKEWFRDGELRARYEYEYEFYDGQGE